MNEEILSCVEIIIWVYCITIQCSSSDKFFLFQPDDGLTRNGRNM
jgi:hypothetical protein